MSSPTTPERHRHQERQQARDRTNVLETPQHRRTPHAPQLTPVHSQGQQYLLDRPLAQQLRAVEVTTPDSLPARGRASRRRTRSGGHAQEQGSRRGAAVRGDGVAQQQDAPPANEAEPAPSRRGRGSRGRGRGGGRAGRGRRGRGDAHASGGAQRTTPPPSSGTPTAANRPTPTSTPQRERDQERQTARERTNILTTPEHRRVPPASILTPVHIDGRESRACRRTKWTLQWIEAREHDRARGFSNWPTQHAFTDLPAPLPPLTHNLTSRVSHRASTSPPITNVVIITITFTIIFSITLTLTFTVAFTITCAIAFASFPRPTRAAGEYTRSR
ncbi:hypothetical protein FB107DRAFT_279454 [Schizophyllum commune]